MAEPEASDPAEPHLCPSCGEAANAHTIKIPIRGIRPGVTV